ncbi:MAG: DnaJ domain-containing protein [bacterium]
MSWIEDDTYHSAVPKLQATNFENIALSAEEGFVLSRVDGHSTIEEICLVTGLQKTRTLETLAKLHSTALIAIPGAPAPEPARDAEPDPPPESISDPGVPAEPMYEPFVAEADCDLSEEKQQEIHHTYVRLDELDFYELLGLHPGCGVREVQRAYRKVSLKYHPDRFFGKELGSYKNKLEAIFRHLSNVAEYLSDDDERATYEASLSSASSGTPRPAGDPETLDELPASPRPRRVTKEDRLRRLSGVLGMSTREIRAAAQQHKPTPGALRTDKAPEISAERKRRIRSDRRQKTKTMLTPLMQRKEKAKRHYDEGVKALLDSNWPAAASNLKLATTFDPKNEEYREKEQLAMGRAREGSALAYAKRAAFEESVGHWSEAARLYCMAVERNPTINNLCNAADALCKGDDLKRAVDYATRAKELDPNSVQARLSLAGAYLMAGMPKNARREVEYALTLDSDNRVAKSLLKDIKRAE